MIQRGLIFFALFVIFPFPLSSFDSTTLSQNRQWQQLLHFRDGKSEIDSCDFFLSPKGKTDAKAELDATVEAIYHDKGVFCKFPARVQWLYANIPTLEGFQECVALQNLIDDYQASKAVLVFPTAHINSPASMFGHTFLRLDDKKGLPLTANAVNYAAKTAETNGLIFAYMGLFGGYEGRYSVLPYYKKIKEYNNLERRDIWEYALNLNKEELARLLTHLYELKDVYADYFFFTENCSYNLLWLLEVARPSTHLVEHFGIKAIPIDTLRAVRDAGFVKGNHFRPSKSKRIQALIREAKESEGRLKEAFKAELDVELLQLKRTEGEIEKKPYVDALMKKLAKRSKLPKLPELTIQTPANPLLSHKTTRITLGVNDVKSVRFGMKLAFHDIYDVDRGFSQGAYIDFFHLILAKERGEGVKLEKLDLVNINSYAVRDEIFQSLSWGVAVGVEDFRDKSQFALRGEVGYTYALGEKAFGFIMIAPKLYVKERVLVGAGPKLGLLASFENVKLGLQAEEIFYSQGDAQIHMETFATIMIGKDTALNLKLDSDKIGDKKRENRLDASLFYYF